MSRRNRILIIFFITLFLVYYYIHCSSAYVAKGISISSFTESISCKWNTYNGIYTYSIVYNCIFLFYMQYRYEIMNMNYLTRIGREGVIKKGTVNTFISSFEMVVIIESVGFAVGIFLFGKELVLMRENIVQSVIRGVSMTSGLMIAGMIFLIIRTLTKNKYIAVFLTMVFTTSFSFGSNVFNKKIGFVIGKHINGILMGTNFYVMSWLVDVITNVLMIYLLYCIFKEIMTRKDVLEDEKIRAEK